MSSDWATKYVIEESKECVRCELQQPLRRYGKRSKVCHDCKAKYTRERTKQLMADPETGRFLKEKQRIRNKKRDRQKKVWVILNK